MSDLLALALTKRGITALESSALLEVHGYVARLEREIRELVDPPIEDSLILRFLDWWDRLRWPLRQVRP